MIQKSTVSNNSKDKIKELENLKFKLQSALEKIDSFHDEKLRLKGSEEMRLDFVRVWKIVPYKYKPKSAIFLSNLCIRKGLAVCKMELNKQIQGVEHDISNIKYFSRSK